MESGVNLMSVVITNIVGILLLITLAIANSWRMSDEGREVKYLKFMMVAAFISCIADPIVFFVDGTPGASARFIIYLVNSWLFVANMLTALCWIAFLGQHLNGGLSRSHMKVLSIIVGCGTLIILANCFVPIVFSVTEDNVYQREMLYWLFLIIDMGILVDSIVVYFISKKKGGFFKLFPVSVYILPILAGMVIQSVFYGVSVVWVCISIAIAGVFASLQNEMIFRDNLTGLFGRAYLDYVQKYMRTHTNLEITGIMLDLNGFKKINDVYGHAEGDEALKTVADLLRSSVSDIGTVIRYAGDEFVVLVNTCRESLVSACMYEIKTAFDDYNESSGKPYKLSVAMGSCRLDLENQSVDEFMNEIDKRMYDDKKNFYQSHAEYDRRRR